MEAFWNQILDKIKEKTSAHIFDTWFKQLRLLENKENTLIIAVPNSFTSDWLNNNYKTILFDSIFEVTGKKI